MIFRKEPRFLRQHSFFRGKLLVFAGSFFFFLAGSIHDALDAGFRHLDDAEAYGRSHLVGEVLHDWLAKTGVPREDWGSGSQNPWRIGANLGEQIAVSFTAFQVWNFQKRLLIYYHLSKKPSPRWMQNIHFSRFQVSCLAFPLGSSSWCKGGASQQSRLLPQCWSKNTAPPILLGDA